MAASARSNTADTAIAPVTVEEGGSPLSTVLLAVASEVADLAEAADGLQALVGRLLSDPMIMIDSEAVERGQVLDAIVQRLQALQTFLAALAPAVQPDWAVDPRKAADMLLLASLAQKRSGAAIDTIKPDNGSCDFF